jgi:hypothetical protein
MFTLVTLFVSDICLEISSIKVIMNNNNNNNVRAGGRAEAKRGLILRKI